MNNDETKKNVVENNSLMRKTKAQLVEIILRKDDVERGIRKELKEAQEFYFQKIKDYNALMQEEYREQCDEHASERQELIDKVTRYKTLFCLSLTFVLMLGIYIML